MDGTTGVVESQVTLCTITGERVVREEEREGGETVVREERRRVAREGEREGNPGVYNQYL